MGFHFGIFIETVHLRASTGKRRDGQSIFLSTGYSTSPHFQPRIYPHFGTNQGPRVKSIGMYYQWRISIYFLVKSPFVVASIALIWVAVWKWTPQNSSVCHHVPLLSKLNCDLRNCSRWYSNMACWTIPSNKQQKMMFPICRCPWKIIEELPATRPEGVNPIFNHFFVPFISHSYSIRTYWWWRNPASPSLQQKGQHLNIC